MSRDVVGELRAAYEAGTPGEWKWWTANSLRSLRSEWTDRAGMHRAGAIAEAYDDRDGMPDIAITEEDMALIVAMHKHLPALLVIAEKAQAVVDRWYTPLWKDVPATAVYIGELRQALSALTTDEGERCEQ